MDTKSSSVDKEVSPVKGSNYSPVNLPRIETNNYSKITKDRKDSTKYSPSLQIRDRKGKQSPIQVIIIEVVLD